MTSGARCDTCNGPTSFGIRPRHVMVRPAGHVPFEVTVDIPAYICDRCELYEPTEAANTLIETVRGVAEVAFIHGLRTAQRESDGKC